MAMPPDNSDLRLGIEISSSALNAVAIGPDHKVRKSRSVALESKVAPIDALAQLVKDLRSEIGALSSFGVAIPGLVERKSGRVAFSAIVPGLSEVNLAEAVSSSTGLPVTIENDANAAAYAEFCCGAGIGCRDMFYATLGEGVGGAFIFNGQLWHGTSGFAGELGYVPINSEGMRLEDVASSANIIRRTRNRFHQDSTSSLGKLDEEALKLEDIISAARNEDDFAQMMLARTGAYVGTAVATVINLLNIERIVVGGPIMQAKQPLISAISERARELSFAPSFASTKIVAGELGADAAAIGAAIIGGHRSD